MSKFHIWKKTSDICLSKSDLLHTMIFNSIHFPGNDIISFFLWMNNTPLSIFTTLSLSILWLILSSDLWCYYYNCFEAPQTLHKYLINCVCSYCSTDLLFSYLSSPCQAFQFYETQQD
jgi:hypothetical protein